MRLESQRSHVDRQVFRKIVSFKKLCGCEESESLF